MFFNHNVPPDTYITNGVIVSKLTFYLCFQEINSYVCLNSHQMIKMLLWLDTYQGYQDQIGNELVRYHVYKHVHDEFITQQSIIPRISGYSLSCH